MSSPTYNDAIPQPGDAISQSQPPILVNFNQANALFGTDHVPFNDATQSQRGRHLKVTFKAPLVADPNLVSPIASLYTKTTGGATQLFFQNGTLTSDVIQLTGNYLSSTNGYYVLPGGIYVQWGQYNISTQNQEFSFPVSFPNNLYTLFMTGRESGSNPAYFNKQTSASPLSTFRVTVGGGSLPQGFSMVAIGN